MKQLRLRHGLFLLLLGLNLSLLALLSQRFDHAWDLSSGRGNSLSRETADLLELLQAPLTITAFLPDHPVARGAVSELVQRMRRSGAGIRLEFVDPSADPDQARRADIERIGAVLLEYRGRSELTTGPREADILIALRRLLSDRQPWLIALSGDGEASPLRFGGTSLGVWGQLLQRQGLRIAEVNLAATGSIPDNADLLLLAAPATELSPIAQMQVQRWLQQGGNLLWLAEGEGQAWLADVLGIRFLPGTVVDAAAADLGLEQPTHAVSAQHPEHPATGRLAAPLVLPGARALQPYRQDWNSQALASSSPRSWNETGALTGTIQRNAAAGEVQGPLGLAFALSRATEQGAEQRVAVIGDVDLFTDASLGLGANRGFALALVRWLTTQDRLAEVRLAEARDRSLRWSGQVTAALGLALVVLLPLGFALMGWLIPRRRRQR